MRPLRVKVGSISGGGGRAGSTKVTVGVSGIGGGMAMSDRVKSMSSGGVDVPPVCHGPGKLE